MDQLEVNSQKNRFRIPPYILPLIVISQFCCTSLWFATNAIIHELTHTLQLPLESGSYLTSSIQFGFILGTLIFAFLNLADRFSPSKIFGLSAFIAAGINLCLLFDGLSLTFLIAIRVLVGFFLAGIYPVGMKIAADYYNKKLGQSLSYLVGALVLGTAFPHLIKTFDHFISWKELVLITSFLAFIGGLLVLLFVKDGPYKTKGVKFNSNTLFTMFKEKPFRSASFGYFGHMWELYTYWAFLPFFIESYNKIHNTGLHVSSLSFVFIALGSFGCILGGYLAQITSLKRTATYALSASGICCILFPAILIFGTPILFIIFLSIWGITVIADSPLFSTLIAQYANPTQKGTALTFVNCIGYSITILSITFTQYLNLEYNSFYIFAILSIGPLFGVRHLVGIK